MSFKIFKDILTEKMSSGERPYSQGRFYLFISVIAYFGTLGILLIKALKPNITINEVTISTIISAEQWIVFLMAGYTFSGKGIDAAKAVMNSKYLSNSALKPGAVDASAGEEVAAADATADASTVPAASTTTVTVSQNGPPLNSVSNPPLTPP